MGVAEGGPPRISIVYVVVDSDARTVPRAA
jgi:hypothetical protein